MIENECVYNFAKKKFKKEITVERLTKPADLPGPGGPDLHPVFSVRDANNALISIIKTYPIKEKDPLKFYPLILGTRLFRSLHLQLSQCPEILTFGREHHKMDLIAMSPAKGLGLHEQTHSSCFIKWGKALEELHRAKLQENGTIPFTILKKEKIHLERFYGNKVDPFFHLTSPFTGPLGILHGDPDPTNVYYERESGTLTLIDLEKIILSVDKAGKGVGPIACEYAEAVCGLTKHCILHDIEPTPILNAFHEGYQLELPKEQVKYYSGLFWIRKINWINQLEKIQDPKDFQKAQKYRELAKEKLNGLIHG